MALALSFPRLLSLCGQKTQECADQNVICRVEKVVESCAESAACWPSAAAASAQHFSPS